MVGIHPGKYLQEIVKYQVEIMQGYRACANPSDSTERRPSPFSSYFYDCSRLFQADFFTSSLTRKPILKFKGAY